MAGVSVIFPLSNSFMKVIPVQLWDKCGGFAFFSPEWITTQPQSPSLPDLKRMVLDEETLLLEYALGEERSLLWAVVPKTLESNELPTPAEIETLANRVRELMLARQSRVKELLPGFRNA